MDAVTIAIRRYVPTDTAAARQVITDAFGDGGTVADLADALRARADRCAQLVAVDGAELVGYVGLSTSWVDAPSRLVEVLVLSPLAVGPRYQRRGVGRELQAAALAEAERLEAPLVFLEGDPDYYRRSGWRPGGPLGFTPPSDRIPPAAFQLVTLAGYDPSEMTGRLVYNDTFWAHDCVGLRP